MFTDRLQAQRFELKFQVPEETARAIRRYLRGYLVPDTYGALPEFPAYFIHSLYLDSSDFQLYHSTVNGDRNRFKLRARYYTDADPFIFLEIKRRLDRCIHKQRARVRRECVAALLAGEPPSPHHLASDDNRQFAALQTFTDLVRRVHATPSAHVAYQREAWCSPGAQTVRVTFDRAIRCEAQSSPHLSTEFVDPPAALFPGRVILELKFTDRFPPWLQAMVDHFDLRPSGAAKYVDGLYTLGPAGLATAVSTAPRRAPTSRAASPFAAATRA